MLLPMAVRNGRQLLDLCCREKFLVSMLASKNPIFFWFHHVCLSFLISILAWLRIQYLPAHEKNQIQDFRNLVQSSSEGTSRSAPESPVIGLIENPSAGLPNADTAEISNEPNPQAPERTPAAAEGASNTDGTGCSGAQGLKGPAVWLVPFQSMPQSTHEELGKELFDDPLLSIDNVKKLAEFMQWSSNIPRWVFCCCLSSSSSW